MRQQKCRIALVYSILVLFLSTSINAQNSSLFSSESRSWADSVLATLTLKEKIGQLFMVAAYSNQGAEHKANVETLITRHKIGGLIFFQGDPGTQIRLTNQYQAISKLPLLIGMDLEWGLGMRLDSTISFPKQMTLGAIKDDKLIYQMGAEIAKEMKMIGVHVNFAPVADINSNAQNPVIGSRSFGEDRERVASKSVAYMNGLQDNGIMANAKHFPGHGDTGTDSHYTMPVISRSKEALDSLELYPFKMMIEEGLMSTMAAHINIPQLDPNPERPGSLSPSIINDILLTELGFEGLVFTDALNMNGVTKYYKPGNADLAAIQAGSDVLLFPLDVPKAIEIMEKAVQKKKLTEERIDRSVRKILMAKHFAGLHNSKPIDERNIVDHLNNDYAKGLKLNLFENAITVVKNTDNRIPIRDLADKSIATVSINPKGGDMSDYMDTYTEVASFVVQKGTTASARSAVIEKAANFDHVIVGLHDPRGSRRKFAVSQQDKDLIREIASATKTTLVIFGSPYNVADFGDMSTLVCAFEDDPYAHQAAAGLIFGTIAASGTLPVSAGSFTVGAGITTKKLGRMGYSFPGAEGMDPSTLAMLDNIATEAIADTATPGCQMLVARNGRIVYHKSHGYLTYDSVAPVTERSIYDIASITKVIATLQAVMFLEERGLIDMDKKASVYLPELKGTNKEHMILRDILTHQAGLWPYLPFWRRTTDDENREYFSNERSAGYENQIATDLFIRNDLRDSVWHWTIDAKTLDKEDGVPYEYRYSDMGYYILERIASNMLNQSMPDFLVQNFYNPLGMSSTSYLPMCTLSDDLIAPTEFDTYFRNDLIRGVVHDQGAALSGGVAGHAGIFSNALDLAKIGQMNLQDGYYGGIRYFNEGTIQRFSSQQYKTNRRGMGWDKTSGDTHGPTSYFASYDTFGHTGFTGTALWIDPEFDLIFVFLSNRIYPDAENTKLLKHNIRTRMQDIIYESIWNFEKSHSI